MDRSQHCHGIRTDGARGLGRPTGVVGAAGRGAGVDGCGVFGPGGGAVGPELGVEAAAAAAAA